MIALGSLARHFRAGFAVALALAATSCTDLVSGPGASQQVAALTAALSQFDAYGRPRAGTLLSAPPRPDGMADPRTSGHGWLALPPK
jgi:hypothetical protein